MVTGWIFVAAGLANLGRLARWYGWPTWREPLVLILHFGYGWFALSLLILGGSILGIGLPARGCRACVYRRRSGSDDSGGDDPRQPGPYGAAPARGSSDGPVSICWSTWVQY